MAKLKLIVRYHKSHFIIVRILPESFFCQQQSIPKLSGGFKGSRFSDIFLSSFHLARSHNRFLLSRIVFDGLSRKLSGINISLDNAD
ncbi:MAG: hypothetical protein IJT05_02340 [Lachnospiraceae bacterium]|nr:hypothetical protein [Lachnospiraceae bacterium]